MSWPFCPQCGTIMDPPETEFIQCSNCPYQCSFSNLGIHEICTRSLPRSKPTWIDDQEEEEREREENNITSSSSSSNHKKEKKVKENKNVKIEEPCPKCGNPELYFYTMQLRSVDEGQTVFYDCPKCNYKFSINN